MDYMWRHRIEGGKNPWWFLFLGRFGLFLVVVLVLWPWCLVLVASVGFVLVLLFPGLKAWQHTVLDFFCFKLICKFDCFGSPFVNVHDRSDVLLRTDVTSHLLSRSVSSP